MSKDEIRNDIVEVLCNVFETKAESNLYISDLDEKLRKNVPAVQIYAWLKQVSEREYQLSLEA